MNDTFIADLQANPLATVSAYYASRLASNPKAIKYLQRNALLPTNDNSSPAEINQPGLPIGFADRTLGTNIPTTYIKLGKTIRKQLKALGILRPNGREHFRGMVTVPLYSAAGEITGMYGRRIDLTNGGAS